MKKIIVADDEELIRKLVCDFLTRDGYEPIQACDGDEVLELFEKNPDVELFILDIMMPNTDGWETCRRIREKSNVPVIMLTARSQEFDELMGFEVGAEWKNGCAYRITVKSLAGSLCRIRYRGIAGASIPFPHTAEGEDVIEFPTEAGGLYEIDAIPAWERKQVPTDLKADRELNLTWDFPEPVTVWRAVNSAPVYEKIADSVTGGTFTDKDFVFACAETVTYKITRADAEDGAAPGAVVTLNHATELEKQRYRYLVRQLNAVCGGAEAPEFLG